MLYVNWNKSNEIVCKALDKFGVHINYGLGDTHQDDKISNFIWSEVRKLYPEDPVFYNFMGAIIGGGLLTFDTEKEALDFYSIFEQELTESSHVYACFYSPVEGGGGLTENT